MVETDVREPTDLTTLFRSCVPRYLGREWKPADGTPITRLTACERRLGRPLPESLRALYLTLGENAALLQAHHRLLSPEQLEVDDEHLVFMEENQSVVSWGIPLASLRDPTPTVWQRNNTPPVEWFSEEKDLLGLLISMWDWYLEMGILRRIP